MATTFTEFQEESASEKVGLVTLEAAKQVVDWTLISGAIYSSSFTASSVIIAFEESSVALSAVSSQSAIVAGTFFHDRTNQKIFMEASDSGNPNNKFMGAIFRLFFSNNGVKQPHDLSTGFDVLWLPLLESTSQFGVEIDNKDTQLGFALEGSGSVSFHNDQKFWKSRYDKLIFENQRVFIHSWSRDLAITKAKLIYRGRIQSKSFSTIIVSFQLKDILNELRAPVNLEDVKDFTYTHDILGSILARITNNLRLAKQRSVYGLLNGHRPTNIDQIKEDGYPVSGTMTVTNGSPTVTAISGTDFITQLRQDDKIIFSTQATREYSIETFPSATSITLSESFDGTTGITSAQVKATRPTQSVNRFFQIAGHALAEPTTTITNIFTARSFEVASINGLDVGNTVTINGTARTIESITDLIRITLGQSLPAVPSVSDTVTRNAVTNAYLDNDLLVLNNDFTVDAANATLQLTRAQQTHPELRLAPLRQLSGTSSFTSGSRTVSGTGTSYKAELKPGDWFLIPTTSTFRQVWSIDSDTSATISETSTLTVGPSTTSFKAPDYYKEGTSVLSVDVIGKSDDGLKTGDLLRLGPEIVEDILTDGGLGSELVSASFDNANLLVEHDIGLAIPEKFSEIRAPTLRSVINKINKSIFGSLFQNDNFKLEYSVLSPERLIKDTLDRSDILNFSVKSDSTKIIKKANIDYNFKEFDFAALASSNERESFTSDVGENLVKTDNDFNLDTLLADTESARIFASRWVFLLHLAKTTVTMQMKMQAFDYEINDKIQITHPKFFERIGGDFKRKIGLVQAINKDITSTTVVIDDLGNAFSRCGAITDNDAVEFTAASDSDKMENGYITDNNGVLGGDTETFGISVIW